MKTLKAFMAVAMMMILASCGGGSFNFDKAEKLCDKYEDDGFDDKDWNEFADLYEDLCEYQIKVTKEILDKDIKPGMTMEDADRIADTNPETSKVNRIASKMGRIIRNEYSDDMPKSVRKKIDKTQEKFNKESNRILKQLYKKMEG